VSITRARFDIPTTEHYAGKNTTAHAVTDERGVTFYFSYRTLIAVRFPDGSLLMRENAWGPTTGRHLNAICTNNERMEGNAFVDAVADALDAL
jgi:hypothetical protein